MTRNENERKRQEETEKQVVTELGRQVAEMSARTGLSTHFCSEMVLRRTMMRMGNAR